MIYPSKVLFNIYPKKFSPVGLNKMLTAKGDRKVVVTFCCSGLKMR